MKGLLVTMLAAIIFSASNAMLKGDNEHYSFAIACKDELEDCRGWAEERECEKNPDFMLTRCPRSCLECEDIPDCFNVFDDEICEEGALKGHCKTVGNFAFNCPVSCKVCGEQAECVDFNDGCREWAKQGECDNNPNFMMYMCRKSCSVCTYKEVMKSSCIDRNLKCEDWADEGECEANPEFMLEDCPLSCKTCERKSSCDDAVTACPSLATSGACEESPELMLQYCPNSCHFCDGDNEVFRFEVSGVGP